MVVMILESVPPSLRGELTRWLIEPHVGVFVGHVNAMVRERLWDKCCKAKRTGGVVQIWTTNNEQRFQMRMAGETRRTVVNFDGLELIRVPLASPAQDGQAQTRRNPARRRDAPAG
jgi:CRISPR-associated protein Cas2